MIIECISVDVSITKSTMVNANDIYIVCVDGHYSVFNKYTDAYLGRLQETQYRKWVGRLDDSTGTDNKD